MLSTDAHADGHGFNLGGGWLVVIKEKLGAKVSLFGVMIEKGAPGESAGEVDLNVVIKPLRDFIIGKEGGKVIPRKEAVVVVVLSLAAVKRF